MAVEIKLHESIGPYLDRTHSPWICGITAPSLLLMCMRLFACVLASFSLGAIDGSVKCDFSTTCIKAG